METVALAVRKFKADRGFERAAALAYTSVFALVPVLTVALFVYTRLLPEETVEERMADFLSQYFLPGSVNILTHYILEFVHRAAVVRLLGIALFLGSAVFLFEETESALNAIWIVRERRSFLQKFVTFWGVLTLTPFLLSSSLYLTARAPALPAMVGLTVAGPIRKALGLGIPLLLTWIAFFLIYALVPFTRVRASAAFVGALAGGLAWEGAKVGLDAYITYVSIYGTVYGSWSVIPIFIIWLYLTWSLVLLGAEVAYVRQHPGWRPAGHPLDLSPAARDYLALRATVDIAGRFLLGKRPASLAGLAQSLDVPPALLGSALNPLVEAGILFRGGEPDRPLLLQRPPSRTTVREIMQALGGSAGRLAVGPDDAVRKYLVVLLERAEEPRLDHLKQISLEDVVRATVPGFDPSQSGQPTEAA